MHEMAMMQSILDTVIYSAQSNGISQITKIKLVIGKLRAVVPDSLDFCFTALKEEMPIIKYGELEIEIKGIEGTCRNCSHTFQVENYRFHCPCCDSIEVAVVGGNELYIDYIEGN